jgi:hypothetical protein
MKMDIVSWCALKIISENENKFAEPLLDRKVRDLIDKFSPEGILLSYSIGVYLPRTISQLRELGFLEEKGWFRLTPRGRELITEETNQWINAILTLAGDKTAKVLCPKCQSEYMNVTDSEISGDETYFNRHVSCNKCGVSNDMKITYRLSRLRKME